MDKVNPFGQKKDFFATPVNMLIFIMGATLVALVISLISLYFAQKRLKYLTYILPPVVSPCIDVKQTKAPAALTPAVLKTTFQYEPNTPPFSASQLDEVIKIIAPILIAPRGSAYKQVKIMVSGDPASAVQLTASLDTQDKRPLGLFQDSVDEYRFNLNLVDAKLVLENKDSYLVSAHAVSTGVYDCALVLLKQHKSFYSFVQRYPDPQWGIVSISQTPGQVAGERLFTGYVKSVPPASLLKTPAYRLDFDINPWKQEVAAHEIQKITP